MTPCPRHFGFVLPCGRCAVEAQPPAPLNSMSRMRPATTTAQSRARRLARDAEIAAQRDDDRLRRELAVKP